MQDLPTVGNIPKVPRYHDDTELASKKRVQ